MRTHSGHDFDPGSVVPNDIRIIDVARGLSCRYLWGGHSRDLMTLAEHNTILSQLVRPEAALAGLLDAASLAYVDGHSPYTELVQDAIMRAFKVSSEYADEVREARDRLFELEARKLWDVAPSHFADEPVNVLLPKLPPRRAEHVFSAQFRAIYQGWS